MGKHLYLVLGNGFTIDFLRHIGKASELDVTNLFKCGSHVKWPVDGVPGFLSFKHCPNLWNLGARPGMLPDEAMALIEDIITCVNVFTTVPPSGRRGMPARPSDIYIFAYKELSAYLKYLFVYYNDKIPLISDDIKNWNWAKFLQNASRSSVYSKVTIVTYNYDIWLERILNKLRIPFQIGLIDGVDPNIKISILKPHGSISFAHKIVRDKSAFTIQLNHDLLDGDISDFSVRHDKLDENYLVSALIPPAGDAGRINNSWASKIRNEVKRLATELTSDDIGMLIELSSMKYLPAVTRD